MNNNLLRAEHESWLASRQGTFTLQCQQALVQRMLDAWLRRGRNLLHLNCGAGLFLNQFWQHGFEVTGFEPDAALRGMAAENAHRSDVEGGDLTRLPFDDNYFDYSIANLPIAGDLHAALRELWRVTINGILLLGWNPVSLHGLLSHFPLFNQGPPSPGAARWRSVLRTLKDLQPRSHISCASTLLLPSRTWRNENLFSGLTSLMPPCPCGAFVAVRMDFGSLPARPSLPLSLLNNFSPKNSAPVMERCQPSTPAEHSTRTVSPKQ